jgi:flavin reductase
MAWGRQGARTTMTTDRLRGQFVDAMGRAVTGVTVVTTEGELGRFGQTVSAMSSVSADPPMLLICISQKSPICQAIERHRVFGVNVLRADQRRFAEIFAGRPRRGLPYDFSEARWDHELTGSPLLAGAVARFDCALEAAYPAGTHTIFVGNVLFAGTGAGAPLVYGRRAYGEHHAFPNPSSAVDPTPGGFDEDVRMDEQEVEP